MVLACYLYMDFSLVRLSVVTVMCFLSLLDVIDYSRCLDEN